MNGVIAFIQEQKDEKIRLVFNDAEASGESENPNWKHRALFTSNTYDADAIKNLSLSKEQYAEIGENLVIRLLTLGGHLK
jgi:hypothetical protein